MYFLINYTGEIRVNQLGVNYDFPHYSTVLGAILSAYHKYMNTPRFPRKDMLELASELGLKLLILTNMDSNKLILEYVQYRNMEKKIKGDANPASPGNRHVIKGTFNFLIQSNNEELMTALLKYPLKIGSNEGTVVEYGLEVFTSLNEFQQKYDNSLFYLKNNKNYSYETMFRKDCIEICLVSQIQKINDQKLFAQGIYSECEWEEVNSILDIELLDYFEISQENEVELIEYIEKINESVQEVIK